MYDLATQAKISEFRQKAIAGTISKEEMIEAARLLTQGRMSAAAASTAAKTTRKKEAAPLPSGDDLLNEMLDS